MIPAAFIILVISGTESCWQSYHNSDWNWENRFISINQVIGQNLLQIWLIGTWFHFARCILAEGTKSELNCIRYEPTMECHPRISLSWHSPADSSNCKISFFWIFPFLFVTHSRYGGELVRFQIDTHQHVFHFLFVEWFASCLLLCLSQFSIWCGWIGCWFDA
jgi:hypothetical protein